MPNRVLREALRHSERVSTLTDREFRLWILLMTCADDFGRFHADPRLVATACYPFGSGSPAKVRSDLEALSGAGLLRLYRCPDGKPFLELTQFRQRTRATSSKFPEVGLILEGLDDSRSSDGQVTVTRQSPAHGDGDGDGDGDGISTGRSSDGHSTVECPSIPKGKGLEALFAEIWGEYPRKEGKQAALAAFKKAVREKVDPATILEGVRHYATHVSALERKYIKQGSTWFRGRHWEDDLGAEPLTADGGNGTGRKGGPREIWQIENEIKSLREIRDGLESRYALRYRDSREKHPEQWDRSQVLFGRIKALQREIEDAT